MVHVGQEEFEELVAAALDQLPPEISAVMDNVAIFVEDTPPAGENLLGLYEGVPLTARSSAYAWATPDRIRIFRLPVLSVCETRGEVKEQVRVTVMHEIGHHFGIDDPSLHDLGYG